MDKINTKLTEAIEATNPNNNLRTEITIYKLETEGIIKIDTSFLKSADKTATSIFNKGVKLEVL